MLNENKIKLLGKVQVYGIESFFNLIYLYIWLKIDKEGSLFY
jgi:hypothetical protein